MATMTCLFRSALDHDDERFAAKKYLPMVEYRSQVPSSTTVIGRYSVLPYYRELEQELGLSGSCLINTWTEHCFIADVLSWSGLCGVLEGLTPCTWADWSRLPEGAYVLKGKTNSRKNKWQTHMFAPTLADVPKVAQRLWDDTMINEQGIVIRQYVSLRQLGEGLNGLPITNEWRTFWLVVNHEPRLIGKGFYWANHPEVEKSAYWSQEAMDMALRAAKRIAEYATFFVLDLAERTDGQWLVIEVNDGQMSGLCTLSAEVFYENLASLVREIK